MTEEVRQWIHSWQRLLAVDIVSCPREIAEDLSLKLLEPIKANDSVLNELLAKELCLHHLSACLASLLLSSLEVAPSLDPDTANMGIGLLPLDILIFLAASPTPYCRRLAAFSVPYLLAIESFSTAEAARARAATSIEAVFNKQEQAVHPMPPSIRLPILSSDAKSTSGSREYTRNAIYYQPFSSAAGQIKLTPTSRLPITLRLSSLFIDFAGEAPAEAVALFCLYFASCLFLGQGHSAVPDTAWAEIADLLDDKQRGLLGASMSPGKSHNGALRAIGEDLLVMLLEFVPFASDRTPATARALQQSLASSIKTGGSYPAALLCLLSLSLS